MFIVHVLVHVLPERGVEDFREATPANARRSVFPDDAGWG